MITLSHPTEHQQATVHTWWVRALVGRQPGEREPFGRCRVSGFVALVAARALVDALLAESRVLVACIDAVPGEAVGFVAWSPATDEQPLQLHMVYVLGPNKPDGARRLGVGLQLLRAAVGDAGHYRATCETAAGRGLLDAFRGQAFKPAGIGDGMAAWLPDDPPPTRAEMMTALDDVARPSYPSFDIDEVGT